MFTVQASVWLISVALLGRDPGDIRFAYPKVEYPSWESCERQGWQITLDWARTGYQAVWYCHQEQSLPPK